MSITIELSPEVESRLEQEAKRNGIDKTKYAGRLIEEHLPTPSGTENGKSQQLSEKQQRLISLMDSWDKEDETDDPAEIAVRQAEWEEFKESINRHHESDRIIFP